MPAYPGCPRNTQPFYGSLYFVRDNPGEPVPEETHLSWSSVIPYLLIPSITIHGILPVQFTCLTVFSHNLSPSFLWSTSWPGTLNFILHTFLHPIIVFLAAHAHTIATCFAVVLRLCHLIQVSLSTLYLEYSSILCSLMPHTIHPSNHSHLCPLKCRLILLSYRPGCPGKKAIKWMK